MNASLRPSDRVDRFFFSSRRRHTSCSRDWSSDVCSSDLAWTEAKSPDKLLSPKRLVVRWRDGTSSVCDDDICSTIRRLGWSDDGATIFFLADRKSVV